MSLKQGLFSIVGLIFLPITSWAGGYGDHYFESLRFDQNVPNRCQDVSLEHFDDHNLETFFYGPEGALDRGFTHEYPVEREGARELWAAAKDLVMGENLDDILRRFSQSPNLQQDLELIADNYQEMGFDFHSEGEILEILAILELQESVGDDYYVFGSVYYSDKVAGELDLMVGRVSDCKVEAVGEAKLGLRMLGKAHKQIDRFIGFLRNHLPSTANYFDLSQYIR